MKFKNYIENVNEDTNADYNGFTVSGNMIDISVQKADYTNLMEISIDGRRTLPNIKSAESFKNEYDEDSWLSIENTWAEVAKKHSKAADKLLQKFERDLNKVLKDLEKDLVKRIK